MIRNPDRNDVQRDLKSLQRDFADLREDLASLATDAVKRGGSALRPRFRRKSQRWVERVSNYVQDKPASVAGVAFASGLVAGTVVGLFVASRR